VRPEGAYPTVPETNHVSRVDNIAAALYSQFVIHVMLFHMLNVLYIYVSSSAVRVQYLVWLFSVVP
jgi:hypothetical protein